jgi:hypothetical protein
VVCIFAKNRQKDGPKDGGAVLGNSWIDVFGDVLKKVVEVGRMIFIVFSFIPEKG